MIEAVRYALPASRTMATVNLKAPSTAEPSYFSSPS
jgi:hypothetical protein